MTPGTNTHALAALRYNEACRLPIPVGRAKEGTMLNLILHRVPIATATAIPIALALIIIEPQQPLVALAAGVLCGLAAAGTLIDRRGRLQWVKPDEKEKADIAGTASSTGDLETVARSLAFA